jgi:hypothetical protein
MWLYSAYFHLGRGKGIVFLVALAPLLFLGRRRGWGMSTFETLEYIHRKHKAHEKGA